MGINSLPHLPRTALTLCLVFTTTSLALGYDAAGNREVVKLLDVGWQTSVRSRPEADAQYAAVANADTGFEGDYAYFLVLLHQRRYTEATQQADRLTRFYPRQLEGWRGAMWVAALTKNYQAAMAAGDKFAELLALEADKPEQGTMVRENLEFLGRVYGFMGGPAGEKVKQEERKAAEKSVVDRLPENLVAAFEETRDAVVNQYLGLANLKADERDKALATAEVEKEKTLEDVDKQRERIESRQAELKDDVDRARADYQNEIDQLQTQDAPLQAQLAQLQLSFARVQGILNTQLNQIAILDQQLQNEEDPRRRDQLLRDIQFIDLNAARTRSELGIIDRQAAVIQQQRAVIAAKANAVQQAFNNQLGLANKAANDLQKEGKRADTIERFAKRPAVGNTTRVTAINAEATALTTYQPFPLEQEKRRLLDLLK